MTTPTAPASPDAPKKDHGRAGRDLPAAIGSAVVLVGLIPVIILARERAVVTSHSGPPLS